MLTRRTVMSMKAEVTDGTDSTPANTNANMVVMDLKFNPDIKTYDRPAMLSTMSKLAPAMGARSAQVSFRAELKGTGASYVTAEPAVATPLKACGFAVSGSILAASAIYVPASTGVKPVTIWFYLDGLLHKMVGCMGNVKFSCKIGEPVIADFNFTGVYTSTSDVAIISPSALENTVPPTALGTTFTVGAYAAVISSFDIDMGNTVVLRDSMSAVNGYVSAAITDRKPTGKIDPELTAVSTRDWFGLWRSGTSGALAIGPIGGVTNNIVTIAAPKVVATAISHADRNGNATLDYSFMLAMNSGDDEISITFT